MNNLPITHLISEDNKKAYSALVDALGTENNPRQWMLFMSAVKAYLPDILSKGRPTKEAIKRSVIGAYGFDSWKQMVEAPVSQNGLGWNWSSWRAWTRAWSVVSEHNFLEMESMSSSEINTLYSEIKKYDLQWPVDSVELQSAYEEIERKKGKSKKDSLKAMKVELESLRRLVKDMNDGEAESTARYQALYLENLAFRKMTRWDHFKKAFGICGGKNE